MISYYKFVPWSLFLYNLWLGYIPCGDLGPTHGEWSVLMEWRGEGEPCE